MKTTMIGILLSSIVAIGLCFVIIVSADKPNYEDSFENTITADSTMEEHLKWKQEFYKWAEKTTD